MNALFADEPLVLDDPYMSRMSEEEFFDFCQQHRKWRIERNAQQEILVAASTSSFTSQRGARLMRDTAFKTPKVLDKDKGGAAGAFMVVRQCNHVLGNMLPAQNKTASYGPYATSTCLRYMPV